AATLCEVGETVYGQAPLWVTVTAWPATVSVPVRAVVDVLAATGAAAVPVRLAGPPAPATLCEVGETVYGQAPLCVTVTVWPATVSVPERAVVEGWAAPV